MLLKEAQYHLSSFSFLLTKKKKKEKEKKKKPNQTNQGTNFLRFEN
jgi:hypothetical protein